MAKSLQITTPFHILLVTLFVFIDLTSQAQGFATTLTSAEAEQQLGLGFKKEKLTHFRLYWHDITSGPNPTSIRVINPPSARKSQAAFGVVNMIDNPLTEGPEIGSKLVGRAQGFYASACQTNVELLMAMNFAFMEGKYNGSTITVLGRNMVFNKVREMPVIGGSGLFRFAKGYVEARTHSFTTKAATVQYDCYVMHY